MLRDGVWLTQMEMLRGGITGMARLDLQKGGVETHPTPRLDSRFRGNDTLEARCPISGGYHVPGLTVWEPYSLTNHAAGRRARARHAVPLRVGTRQTEHG